MPAPQVAVQPRGHRRLAAHLVDLVAGAAAERGRDDRVDHARVERIARDADPGVRQHLAAAGRADADHREVGGASAEIGDHDQLVVIEPRRVARRRADRLVLEHHLVEPGGRERHTHALDRPGVVLGRVSRPSTAPDGRPRPRAPEIESATRRGSAEGTPRSCPRAPTAGRRSSSGENDRDARWLLIDCTSRPSPPVSR